MGEPREAIERADELAPRSALLDQLFAAGGGQLVVTAAALAGFFHPAAFDQALALETVEHRVQRGDVKLEAAFGLGLDALGELVPVPRAPFEQGEQDHARAAFLNIRGCHMWR